MAKTKSPGSPKPIPGGGPFKGTLSGRKMSGADVPPARKKQGLVKPGLPAFKPKRIKAPGPATINKK